MIKYLLIIINFVFSIEFDAPYMEKYELENGMTILLSPIYDQPMIHINTLVKAGDMNGGENKYLVAELTESLLRFETEHFNHDEFVKYIDNIGVLWAWTQNDHTMFNLEGMKDNIEQLISFQSEIFRYPKFNEKYFGNRKEELLGWQKLRDENSPENQASFHAQNMILGTKMNLYSSNNNITLDDIKTFYNSFYYPRNMTLMISGDFNVSYAKILIEKHFGNWKNRKEIKSTKKLVSKKSDGINVRFINCPNLSNPTIRIIMPAVSIENPDFLSFYSAFHIIGKGRNSRIYNSINSIPGNWEENYYSAFAWERTYDYFIYQYKASYTDIDKVYNLIINEIENIGQNNITNNELQIIKKKEVGETILDFEIPRNWNRWVINALNAGSTIDNIINWTRNLQAVTLNDVNDAGNKYWNHEKFYLIIFGDKDSTETFLNQFENVDYYEKFASSK